MSTNQGMYKWDVIQLLNEMWNNEVAFDFWATKWWTWMWRLQPPKTNEKCEAPVDFWMSKCLSFLKNEVVNNNVEFGNIERKWKLKEKTSRLGLGWYKKCWIIFSFFQ